MTFLFEFINEFGIGSLFMTYVVLSFYILGVFKSAHDKGIEEVKAPDGTVIDHRETYAILWGFKEFVKRNLSKSLADPIITCPKCMPTFHIGLPLLVYLVYMSFLSLKYLELLPLVPLTIGAVSGITGLLFYISRLIKILYDYYKVRL